MKKILLTILISGFIFLSNPCSVFAQSLSLQINSTSFVSGNSINIIANVYNYSDYSLQYEIQSVLTHSNQSIFARPIEKELIIEPNSEQEIQFYNLLVEDDFPSGRYDVKADLFEEGRFIQTENLDFIVAGTKKSIEAVNLLVCKDLNCNQSGKIFQQGEYIYLDYDSDIIGLTTSAKLIYPDETEKTIKLPTSFRANQIGTYKVEVSASKSGYLDKQARTQFAVIKASPKIKTPFGAKTVAKPIYDDDYIKDSNLGIREQIKILLNRINQLKQQLSGIRAQKTSDWSYNFNKKLKFGDKGVEVEAMQTALEKQGFTEVKKDIKGVFGENTSKAVIKFQEKYRKDVLSQWGLNRGTGFVGTTTLRKLNELYKHQK